MITLKSTGIVRKVDELGRIVLPIELRRTLDIARKTPGDLYGWTVHHSRKNISPPAFFCDDARDVIVFRGKNICPKCIKALQECRTVLI